MLRLINVFSPLDIDSRPTKECDIVMPDQARAIASELGLPYYETRSVHLTQLNYFKLFIKVAVSISA